jgi:metal-responsive CopG/Arc/MetJ family transcriptional regulator
MPQITAVIENDLIDLIDKEAEKNKLSRSKQISECLETYFHKAETTLNTHDSDVEHMKTLLQSKDDRIKDLENMIGFLQGQYIKLNVIVDKFALPPPKEEAEIIKKSWWQIWK